MSGFVADIVVLVPDKNMEAAVRGLLSRPGALSIRALQWKVYIHIERDPGCFHRGHDFLRSMAARYAHGLLMFDRQGSGQENKSRESLEQAVETRLSHSGWGDRAAAIVLDPELEIWVWSDSPEVNRCLGWISRETSLRSWLYNCNQRLWPANADKPSDPKAAVDMILREVRKPRSSAIYEQLARQVSVNRCTDLAFKKFKLTLQNWFPADEAPRETTMDKLGRGK
jgi:hypothetical protein